MVFILPKLDYERDAFVKKGIEYISPDTITNHYEGHHAAYIKNLNSFLQDSNLLGKDLEQVVRESYTKNQRIFNNAAQTWNHNFYWKSISPDGGGMPKKTEIDQLLRESFGSYEQFYQNFKNAAKAHFGSGWIWLVMKNDGKLDIVSTLNAETPITRDDVHPLAVADVWEHAYYLDYQYRRLDYISVFLTNLLNWDFVKENIDNFSKTLNTK